jgi:GT2 family glycosyltransferase
MQIATQCLITQVKERLLPLPPSVRALEWLIERLPRQLIMVTLTPHDEIEVIDKTRGKYKATGNNAAFEINFIHTEPRCGWYYLEAALTRNIGSREASICIEIRSKPNERITILIPSTLRGSVREVWYLPDEVKTLYWRPTTAPGFFSQSQLLIHKISTLESLLRRLYRVIYDILRQRRVIALATVKNQFFNLQSAYEASARLRINRLMGNNYTDFILKYDTLDIFDLYRINLQIRKFVKRPLVTIIMTVRENEARQLAVSIGSLNAQLYSHWELLIACNSQNSYLQVVSLTEATNNPKIKALLSEGRTGQLVEPATLLNEAIQAACGEWIIRMCPGDCLPKHAICHIAAAINHYPEALFVYGDDDDIDNNGQRSEPRFKPDWNLELLRSHDYIGNPAVYHRATLLGLGSYTDGYEGAEDYELRLRFLGGIQENKIRHVHKILYHRNKETRTTCDIQAMHAAGRKALIRNFQGTAIMVENGAVPFIYRIRYPLISPPPLASIIVPTRDKSELLRACIESIRAKTDYSNWEMLIMDNDSSEPAALDYMQELKSDPRIRVLHYDKPYNYSAINNLAVNHARGEVLVLLNNDIEVIVEDWLTEMVSHAMRREIGAVGAKLLYPDGTVQHAGVILGIGGVAAHVHKFLPRDAPGYCNRAVVTQNISAVTGACLAVRKKLYRQVGGLDEKNLHIAYNDIDFCLKLLRAGYKNIFTPYALLYHHESITRGADDTPEKEEIYQREYNYMKKKWGSLLTADQAYNRNLSLENEYFSTRI